jgi:predicted oxidoreductase (fatty acid repression mutant protein)
MARTFKEALVNRRSYYTINNTSPISDHEIEEILQFALKNVPSPYNSQSTRIVLLLGENHIKMWEIVKSTLKKIIPEKQFTATKKKIDESFACGYGTVLFFIDDSVTEKLEKTFPSFGEKFPLWAQHSNAMHQLSVWTMLEDSGLGASLQHYNPLIDKEVKETWNLNSQWQLVAEMPFGTPTAQPDEKEYMPMKERFFVFK